MTKMAFLSISWRDSVYCVWLQLDHIRDTVRQVLQVKSWEGVP